MNMSFQKFQEEVPEQALVIEESPSQIYRITQVMDQSRIAINKLLFVALICLIFMIVEITGGYLANSLAIMTDAAHLFSDISGFFISIVSLMIGQIHATEKMSYGYYRAEIVGAMSSVILIWGLTIWLVYEAIQRVLVPEQVQAKIMLITACLGLVFNIVMMKVLHGPGHGHHHGHDHGSTNNHDQTTQVNNGSHQHDHSNQHDHSHKHDHSNDHDNSHKHDQSHKHDNSKQDDHSHKHDQSHNHDHSLKHDNSDQDDHSNHNHDHSQNNHTHDIKQNKIEINVQNEAHNQQQTDHGNSNDDHKHSSHNLQIDKQLNDVDMDQINESHHHDHQNMNVRAAFVHLIGDTVQSVGVIIAALLIFYRPLWTLIDPICTFLFSIIVIFTTVPITRDCIAILMESTPKHIDTKKFMSDILAIPNVQSLHDLHIWSITSSKIALSAHIRTTTPSQTLRQAQVICSKHKIFHCTIQVENPDDNHLFDSNVCELRPCL